MKREAQPILSVEGQQALDQYTHLLWHVEDLMMVMIRNYLSDLRQFMVWCGDRCWQEQDEQPFTKQAIAPPLLIRYRTYLLTSLWLKPSTINRTLMSLKRYFTLATWMQIGPVA